MVTSYSQAVYLIAFGLALFLALRVVSWIESSLSGRRAAILPEIFVVIAGVGILWNRGTTEFWDAVSWGTLFLVAFYVGDWARRFDERRIAARAKNDEGQEP